MSKDDWIKKLTSRKFWMCAAAFLGSIATSIAGLASQNEKVAIIGVVCGMLSSAIYAAAEAYTDGKRAEYPIEKEEDF